MTVIESIKERLAKGEQLSQIMAEDISLQPDDISSDVLGYQDLLKNPEIKKLAEEGNMIELGDYLRKQNFANLANKRYRRIAAFLIYQATLGD